MSSQFNQNLSQILATTGQYPAITLTLQPLLPLVPLQPISGTSNHFVIKTFLEYRFKASVVQPISDFSFTFVFTDSTAATPLSAATNFIHEGDIVLLTVNLNGQEYSLATGIIDTVEVQVTAAGETVTIMGRDLLGQWEDQGQYQAAGKGLSPIKRQMTPTQLYAFLAQNTRSQANQLVLNNIDNSPQDLGIGPMDTKLQVVVNYLDARNALVYCQPNGQIVWGKPNFVMPQPLPVIIVSKSQGMSNCLSIRATRSANTVPYLIKPLLSGSENALFQDTNYFTPVTNPFGEVRRLASLGNQLTQIYVSSDPSGGDPQSLNSVSAILSNGGNIVTKMNAYAIREMARQNMRILQVQAVVPGHVNGFGLPFLINTMYQVVFDRAGIDSAMYLYEIEYSLNETEGPRTLLNFVYPNTIVGGNTYK